MLITFLLILFTSIGINTFATKENIAILNALYITIFLINILLFGIFIISDYYTGIGISESTLFLMLYGFNGISFYQMIIPLFLLISFIFVIFFSAKYPAVFEDLDKRKRIILSSILLTLAIIINPAIPDILNLFKVYNKEFSLSEYEEFNKFYEEPQIFKTGDEKNLVFIYLEGLERSYLDQQVFPDLLPNLYQLKKQAVDFSNIQSGYGADHTIGGFVASLCGIVLTPGESSYNLSSRYLPKATCLGDLLKSVGYHNTYIGGANSSFTGKGTFFKEHGFDEVLGLEYFKSKLEDPNYVNYWGLYDDSLFSILYDKFIELSEKESKFTLFSLTLATHHPHGNIPKTCENMKYKDGSIEMLNAVYCSDKLIGDFVRKIQDSEYGKDTVIILSTDQYAGNSDAQDELQKTDRKMLYLVLSKDEEPREIKNGGFLLDVGLSSLPFIGYQGSLGLAKDLSEINRSKKELDKLEENVKEWVPIFSRFWDFPKIEESITLDPEKTRLSIDGRQYKTPILLKYDEELNTSISFSSPYSNTDLSSYSVKEDNRYFLIFDKCSSLKRFSEEIQRLGPNMCMIIGFNGEPIISRAIENETVLSKDELMPHINNI